MPMEGALFVQQLRTEKKKTGNVVSAQNGCARTALSGQFKQNVTIGTNNHTRVKFHSHLCSKLYFIILKHFKCFTLYNCMENERYE